MSISWSPLEYKIASVLAKESGQEMLARLQWMTLKPQVIIDAGCGTGETSIQLKEKYQHAQIILLDSAWEMVEYAKQQTNFSCLCADALNLPIKDQSVDLIFANFLFPWQNDIEALFKEWHRVLRPDGILMFSAFGKDTLKELNQSISPLLVDMHDVGDLLVRQKFADPVLDVNYYTMSYPEQSHLLKELQTTGMITTNQIDLSPAQDGKWEVTYEVIFAHAFRAEEKTNVDDGIVRIPLSQLRRQINSR